MTSLGCSDSGVLFGTLWYQFLLFNPFLPRNCLFLCLCLYVLFCHKRGYWLRFLLISFYVLESLTCDQVGALSLGFHYLERGGNFQIILGGLWKWLGTPAHFLFWPCQALGVCLKKSHPFEAFVISILVAWLVLGKLNPKRAYLVSWIHRSVTGSPHKFVSCWRQTSSLPICGLLLALNFFLAGESLGLPLLCPSQKVNVENDILGFPERGYLVELLLQ